MKSATNEKPILFSGPMIRALRSGMKTVTRRIIRQVPTYLHLGRPIMDWSLSGVYQDDDGRFWLDVQTDVDDNTHTELVCPYGSPGTRLWVKEALWMWGRWLPNGKTARGRKKFRFEPIGRRIIYERPETNARRDGSEGWVYRHARYVPRVACRIVLEVEDVRVERLAEITEEDIAAEGFTPGEGIWAGSMRGAFAETWNRLNSDRGYSWSSNPFVWRVQFKVVEGLG